MYVLASSLCCTADVITTLEINEASIIFFFKSVLVQPILSILGLPFELGRLWNAHFPCYKQILVMTSESTKGKHIFSLILLKTGNGPFGGEPISSLSESLLLLTSQEWSVTWGGSCLDHLVLTRGAQEVGGEGTGTTSPPDISPSRVCGLRPFSPALGLSGSSSVPSSQFIFPC